MQITGSISENLTDSDLESEVKGNSSETDFGMARNEIQSEIFPNNSRLISQHNPNHPNRSSFHVKILLLKILNKHSINNIFL